MTAEDSQVGGFLLSLKGERNLKPLFDQLVLRAPKKLEETSNGGIILPSTVAPEKPQMAEVVFAGSGKIIEDGNLLPMELKVGDTVIFPKYAAIEVKIDGEDMLLLKEKDCLAILEEVKVV